MRSAVVGWLAAMPLYSAPALARSIMIDIGPASLDRMSFPVQLEYAPDNSGLRFVILSPIASTQDLSGWLKVKRGDEIIVSTSVTSSEKGAMRSWSFILHPDFVEGASFSLGGGRVFSLRAWIFALGPLQKASFELIDNNGVQDSTAPDLSLGRDRVDKYWRLRLGPKYAWAPN